MNFVTCEDIFSYLHKWTVETQFKIMGYPVVTQIMKKKLRYTYLGAATLPFLKCTTFQILMWRDQWHYSIKQLNINWATFMFGKYTTIKLLNSSSRIKNVNNSIQKAYTIIPTMELQLRHWCILTKQRHRIYSIYWQTAEEHSFIFEQSSNFYLPFRWLQMLTVECRAREIFVWVKTTVSNN